MKKVICSVMLLMAMTNTKVSAQASGYMGKRFMAGYDLVLCPWGTAQAMLDHESLNKKGKPLAPITGVILKHNLGAEIVIKDNASIRIGVQFTGSGSGGTGDFSNGSNIPGGAQYKFTSSKVKEFKISYVKYVGDFIAPVGVYAQYGLSYVKGDVTHHLLNGSEMEGTSFKGYGFNWGIGAKRVFYDCLVLDYGVDIGFMLYGDNIVFGIPVDAAVSSYSGTPISPADVNAIATYSMGMLINFRIGTAYLF